MAIKYCACIVLFGPGEKELNRIREYRKIFDFILLFNNTEGIRFKDQNLPDGDNVSYFGDGNNYGLAYAYQYAFQWALQKEADYLCTLDQDSRFGKRDITNLKNAIERDSVSISNAAIIAPLIRYGRNIKVKRQHVYRKVNWVISSGSFINLRLFESRNIKFDSNYFIDRIDRDIGMQIKNQGMDVLQYNDSVLNQSLGDANGHIQTNHIPLRHYYIFRNRLYFNNKYYAGPKKILINLMQSIKHVCLIVIYENNKREKIRFCYRGYLDYKSNVMGKMVYEK